MINAILLDLAGWLNPWIPALSTAFMATLLVIFGQSVNRHFRLLIRNLHFVLRALLFVILCAVGYGFLTVQGGIWLSSLLWHLDPVLRAPVVLVAFLAVGWYAERHSV